jgi:hypothetical protein
MEDGAVVVEGAAALVRPGARDGRDAQRRVHIVCAVARTREAVAEPEIAAWRRADHARERLDRVDRQPGDGARPLRRLVAQVCFQLARAVRVLLKVRPVGMAIAEQHMHDGAGQRTVGAGLQAQRQVRLLHGAVLIDVDRDDLGAALFAGAHGVRHDVDLRADGIGAPDHHQVGLGHLAWIGPGQLACAGDEPVQAASCRSTDTSANSAWHDAGG